MNEREFGTHVAEVLKNIFPTMLPGSIQMERSFSLKFGHHNIVVDGKEPGNYAKRSIYDILLKINDEPLAILELKKPKVKITDEDIRQGVSYARLITPIAPLTIVSNGDTTRLIDTYSGDDIDEDTIDIAKITSLFKNALNLSRHALKDSITNLFENDHRIIFNVINTISRETFEGLSGAFNEVRKPIMWDFRIEREIETTVRKVLDKGHNGFITGDPLVGKTTYLYQLFLTTEKSGNALLYINCSDQYYSIFRKLAVFITRQMQYMIDENKVKEWLLLGLSRATSDQLIVAFDHLRFDAEPVLKAELAELYDLFAAENNRMIIATDNSNYDLLTKTEGRRTENFYGKNFKRIKLAAFSSEEFDLANNLLFDKFGSGILAGGSFSGEYRNARIWRLLALATEKERTDPNTVGVIDAVPSLGFLRLTNSYWQFDPQTVQDFRELTKAYLEALPVKDTNGYIKLMALNLPVIEERELMKHIQPDVIRRLEGSGFIEKRLVPGHLWVYLPKLPELIASFATDYLKKKYKTELTADFEVGYTKFMDTCQYLPFGEIIAAKIIIDWGYANEIELFSRFITKLKDDKPEISSSSGGMLVRMYLPGKGHVDLDIPPGEEQKFVNNLFPYLILSHLVALGFVDESKHPDMERARCIVAVAETDFMIRSLNVNTIFESVPTMDIGNIGNVIRSDIGIIEPIVQSIQNNIIASPKVVEAIFGFALEQKSYRLLHRIYIAARYTPYHGIKESDDLCERIKSRYMEHFNKMMAFALAPAGANRTERRKIEKRLNKLKTKRKL